MANGVGMTVYGYVSGYTKGRALVQLQKSEYTAILSLRDYHLNDENQFLEKILPLGTQIKAKVVEFSKEGDKRLIRLSTLPKHFEKYKGLEVEFEDDEHATSLWDKYQKYKLMEVPKEAEQVEEPKEAN